MSSSPREIGTLIVVVLRANTEKSTEQTAHREARPLLSAHPEWDEELRFSIYEDAEDELTRTAGDKTPPPKERFRNIKGGKSMRVWSLDFTEALTKGEVDEWFTIQSKDKYAGESKDKYAGEVYLEMTFWSNARPPAKKKAPRPSTGHPQYGGPGSFTPSASTNASAAAPSSSANSTNEIPAFLRPNRETSPAASVPDSLRPSTSALGQPDLYISPYNSQNSLASQHSSPSALEPAGPPYDDFGRLGQNSNHRRDSYPPSSLYSHPSNGAIPQPAYQQSPYDPFSASSLPQSMLNMHIGQPPAPSTFPPPTPAPSFAPSQFGYVSPDNVPPPFPPGPGYPGLGYGPSIWGNRLASAGFAAPPPIPTPMPFNVPPPVTPFQQPPNPSHTPFPQQHPYQPQQYPLNTTPAPLPQNGPLAGQFVPFSPQTAPPGHGMFPPQQGLPPPQSTSPPRGVLPHVPQQQPNGPQHQSTPPFPPQSQPYLSQQLYSPRPPQNPPPLPPLQTHNSSGSSRPLPTPQQSQGPSSSSSSFGHIPGSFPPPPPNANGQQWHPPAHHNQSPPPKHFQAPPPPPSSSFHAYQSNPESQLPPPPSAYQQPPPHPHPHPHPQQQLHSVPIGGIFPGPSTTTIYPGPPPKPPQMVAPQHNGWQ
ncbi:hypothetical protein RSAG8_06111, partial [Rhizoctonia solani AG-8 WAC10335]